LEFRRRRRIGSGAGLGSATGRTSGTFLGSQGLPLISSLNVRLRLTRKSIK
jgi:hypothetical protein